MSGRQDTRGCCSDPEVPRHLDERAELGRRRLRALRRVAATAAVLLCVAALLVSTASLPVDPQVGGRLALAAALLGVPRLLGVIRQVLHTRRPSLPAVVALALVVAAVAGFWLVVGVAVAAVLVSDLVERHPMAAPVPAGATGS